MGGIRWLRLVRAAVLPWLIMGAALWLAHAALRLAIADLIYPQQRVLQRSHWVYRVKPEVKTQQLHQALRWTPDNPWYWRTLADLQAQTARRTLRQEEITESMRHQAVAGLQQAAAWYERALDQQPTEPYVQLARFTVLHNLAALDVSSDPTRVKALATLATRIATLAPSKPALQYALGFQLLAGNTGATGTVSLGSGGKTTLPFFRQVLRLDASFYQRVLQAYRQYLPAAEALYHFAVTIPHTPQGHLKAGRVLEGRSWRQAQAHYRVALVLNESDHSVMRAYAAALQRHREFAAAREMWQRLRDANPDDATAYLGLANAFRGLGDHVARLQTLQQLVARFPRHVGYRSRLARTYQRLGKTTEAEAAWRTVIDIQPQATDGYVGMARLYASRRDYAAAIAIMQRVVGMAPGTVAYHRHLARLYEKHGESAKALREYKRLAALWPDNPEVQFRLGNYFRKAGELRRAIDYYRRAVRLKPHQTRYRQALEKTLEKVKSREAKE